jgi:glycosyltransferase involved in cell wall biosynthesis
MEAGVPHLFHVFPTFVPGGSQVRTAGIIGTLGSAWRHSVMAMDGRFGAEQRIRGGAGVELVAPPDRKNIPSLAKAIREHKPDLLLTYNWGAIESTAAAWLYSLCPVVHTEDGFGADEAHGPKLRRALARRVILNRIRMTVVPSRTLLDIALTKYGIAREKVRFIANGVDLERFQPRRDMVLRRSLGVPDDSLVFGFAGILRPEKNLTLLLRAFRKADLPGSRLLLVGDGPCRENLETEVRGLSIREKVIFAGAVADTSLYYAAFDVFVMSSATEQMPLSLLEAMACGLPAVCTNAGDTAAILGETNTVSFPSGDVDAYAQTLRRVAANPELRATQGAGNRRRAERYYSYDRMAGEYEEVYRFALKGRNQQSGAGRRMPGSQNSDSCF